MKYLTPILFTLILCNSCNLNFSSEKTETKETTTVSYEGKTIEEMSPEEFDQYIKDKSSNLMKEVIRQNSTTEKKSTRTTVVNGKKVTINKHLKIVKGDTVINVNDTIHSIGF